MCYARRVTDTLCSADHVKNAAPFTDAGWLIINKKLTFTGYNNFNWSQRAAGLGAAAKAIRG